ncbi:MAG: D-alanyl-D-alanine carboxypeptidase [Treponema sp.]|jgi:D-alanyl-D-alanine carboxypeptidase (penicillin-binding protein 5/6)|nr:D-alanyl-D-alanine carboxypeptidase [Treponema sp.]
MAETRGSGKALPAVLLFLFLLPSSGGPLFAQIKPGLLDAAPPGPELSSQAAVLMDAETGTVLYRKNEDLEIPPASLTKLMAIHLALEEIAAGRASLDELFSPPRESWAVNMPPRSSLMFLAAGQRLSLRELLLGLAIPSGNDAAVALALRFAPSVGDFVEMMNREALRLGLKATRFVEPSGISEDNWTTAGEFAQFCRIYLRLHPETLAEYHSVPEFAYPKAENVGERYRENPGTILQPNRNNLLKNFPGVDGLKTGYIDEAGYNIALTAERDGTRFVAVILGAPALPGGDRLRDEDGRKLLTWAFDNFKTLRPLLEEPEPVRLWKGKENWVELTVGEDPAFTIPASRGNQLWLSTELIDPLVAPLPASYRAGDFILSDEQGELRRIPLLSAREYEEGNFFKRLWDSVRLFFRGLGKSV